MSISILKRPQHAAEISFDHPFLGVARETMGIGVQAKQRLWQRVVRVRRLCCNSARHGPRRPVDVMERLDLAVSAAA
jgi:hypothetical protein